MFNFKKEAKDRYNKLLEKYPLLNRKEEYKGCVYFIGELSPIKEKHCKLNWWKYHLDSTEKKQPENKEYIKLVKSRIEEYGNTNGDKYDAFRYIKIGYSTDVKKRLSALQTSNARELILVGIIDNVDQSLEKEIHNYLEALIPECRVRGEWFDFSLIKPFLSIWFNRYNKDFNEGIGFYDREQDLLRIVDIFYEGRNADNCSQDIITLKSDGKVQRKSLPTKELNWINENISQYIKGSTAANKNHIDYFGDLIRSGDNYFQIDYSSTFGVNDKLSSNSFKKIYNIIDKMGLKTNVENLKFYLSKEKEKYDTSK